jgi:hypothetical protein
VNTGRYGEARQEAGPFGQFRVPPQGLDLLQPVRLREIGREAVAQEQLIVPEALELPVQLVQPFELGQHGRNRNPFRGGALGACEHGQQTEREGEGLLHGGLGRLDIAGKRGAARPAIILTRGTW